MEHIANNRLPTKKKLNKDFDEYFLNNKKIQNSLNEIDKLIDDEKIIYLDDRTKDYFTVYHKQKSKNNSLNINTLRNLISERLKIDDFDLNILQNSKIHVQNIYVKENVSSRKQYIWLDKISCH